MTVSRADLRELCASGVLAEAQLIPPYLHQSAPPAPWLLPDNRPPLAVWRLLRLPCDDTGRIASRSQVWRAVWLVLHGLEEELF